MITKKTTPVRIVRTKLVFYFNRIKKHVPTNRNALLNAAKEELRILFGRN